MIKDCYITSIMPIGLTANERLAYEKLRMPPQDLLGTGNKILLCKDCASDYLLQPAPDTYTALMDMKADLTANAEIVDTMYDIEIEEGINFILDSLITLQKTPVKEDITKWKAYKVDKKIKDNVLLKDAVTERVLTYYRYIRAQFKQREREGLRFNKVKNEVSQCFETLDEAGKSKQEIFDLMVKWIGDKTGCNNMGACAVIISFFVQNCEVFYIDEATE